MIDQSIPALVHITDDNINLLSNSQVPILLFFINRNQKQNFRFIKEKAEELKGKYIFAVADMKDPSEQDLAKQFGINKGNLPALFLTDVKVKTSYKFDGNPAYINQFQIQEFVDSFEKGKLTPFNFASGPGIYDAPKDDL